MSDPPTEPPPPPPPPNLAPPPGYAAYQSGPPSAAPLRRVGGLRTAILVLLAVFALGTIIQLVGTPGIVDSAKDFLADEISEDQFTDDYAAYTVSGVLAGVAQLALMVLSIIWLFRTIKNHRSIGRRLTWGPGWAIGGWFLPPLILYIIPLLVLRETWKASDPQSTPSDERWKQSADSPLLWIWWVLFGVAPLVFIIAGLRQQLDVMGGDAADLADSLDGRLALLMTQSVVVIVAAVAWGLLVRALTARHTRLTGEAGAR